MKKHCLLKYLRENITLYLGLMWVVIPAGQHNVSNSSQARMSATLHGDLLNGFIYMEGQSQDTTRSTPGRRLKDFNKNSSNNNSANLPSPLCNCITLCVYVSLWTTPLAFSQTKIHNFSFQGKSKVESNKEEKIFFFCIYYCPKACTWNNLQWKTICVIFFSQALGKSEKPVTVCVHSIRRSPEERCFTAASHLLPPGRK